MPKFYAGLCQLWNGQLAPPYEATVLEENSEAEVFEAAKRWAHIVERREDAWLVVQFEGAPVVRFNPDEF